MKRFLLFILTACALVGCTPSPEKALPVMRDYLKDQISKPETYNPGIVEFVSKGSIDVSGTKYWQNIPASGNIDVVLLRHEFNYETSFGMNMDKAYYFYMNPKMDLVYYAHPDSGGPLFTLSE